MTVGTAGLGSVWSWRADMLDEALVVQSVACRQAVLAACCLSLHPKDVFSCRSYIVYV